MGDTNKFVVHGGNTYGFSDGPLAVETQPPKPSVSKSNTSNKETPVLNNETRPKPQAPILPKVTMETAYHSKDFLVNAL